MNTKRMIPRAFFSLGLALALASCSDGGELTGVFARMELRPEPGAAMDFGLVVLGEESAEPAVITVASKGDVALELQPPEVDGEASAFSVSSAPTRLAPGQSGEIFVRFNPDTPKAFSASLVVRSNDPDQREARLSLSGAARERCQLALNPPHQFFELDQTLPVELNVLGSQPCEIIRISLDRELFEIVDEPELPLTLEPGETRIFDVRHHTQSTRPGIPTRELRFKESEGAELVVTLEGEPPVQDCLSITPEERLLFPTTPVGQIARLAATVSNQCAEEARVLSAFIGTGYAFEVDTGGFPLIVPSNGEISIVVTYDPVNESGDNGVLNINTNDATNARFSLELAGQASKPRIQVFPQVLDFGAVLFRPGADPMRSDCGAAPQTIQLYSIGDAEVVIERMEFEAGDDHFQISGVLIDGRPVAQMENILLPPNKEGRIDLRFHASRLQPALHEGALLIYHSAEGSPSRVLLRAEALDDVVQSETFNQLTGPKFDVLWVVQNTWFGDDEQAKLAGYMDTFIANADAAGADYHMAVTVTDSRSPSAGNLERCFPHPIILSSDYATQDERIEAIKCAVNVGVRGSFFFVSGLGAAMRTVEKATDINSQDPNVNPGTGFVREDAQLIINVVATRDDDSVESNALLLDYFRSIKGAHRPDRMVVNTIAGPVLGPCPGQHPFLVWPGYRYFWMTDQTGGFFQNVCAEDWTPFFDAMGLDIFRPIDEWDLKGAADPSTLVVTVNGSPVPSSQTDGYTYNNAGNSIRFSGNAVPPPGATVDVAYSGICRP